MNKVKRLAVTGAASAVMLGSMAVPAFAVSVSDNANQQGCFGQARAYYAQHGPNGVLSPDTQGDYSSERKGNNAEMNREYRESCQSS